VSPLAIDFPLSLGAGGDTRWTASATRAAEQLIEELLFTAPGERLTRPDLGCGLLELVFDPARDELRAATQFQIAASLEKWLSGLVRIVSVTVGGSGAELEAVVEYQLAGGVTTRSVTFRQ
jgi:phage baseplate assembly protein W